MSLGDLGDSVSYSIFEKVSKMAAMGGKVYPLAIGEPSFHTPRSIIDKAHASMKAGDTHYVSSFGIPEVRSAIRDKVRKRNGINAAIENTIFITTKLGVYASLVATAGGGGEVLIPDPGYFYDQPVRLAGALPVRYQLASDYSLDLDEVRRKATKKTRAIIVNTPSNPTGRMLTRSELKSLLAFCQDRGIKVLSDESYEELVYRRAHVSIGSLEPEPSSVISLFSLSKSFAMTGWRAGYVVGSEEDVRLINRFIEHTVSCFPAFIQHASAFALRGAGGSTDSFREELRERRDIIEGLMLKAPRLDFVSADGAFYEFPKYDARLSSLKFCQTLLDSTGVAVLPGSIFGAAGEKHLRISFAAPRETIEGGMRLLGGFLAGLGR